MGRRSTLHSYSLRDHTWTSLASAPGSPRGGTAFVALGSVLVRFGGFDGQELGGSVETYDTLANSWSTHPFEVGSGPGNRSVATFLPHPSYPTLKSVLIFGERSPSSKGHSGAGTFWSDIWVYDLEKDKWEQVEADISHVTEGGCGWGAGAVDLQSKELILWGGLDNQNQRVGTGLRVQIA